MENLAAERVFYWYILLLRIKLQISPKVIYLVSVYPLYVHIVYLASTNVRASYPPTDEQRATRKSRVPPSHSPPFLYEYFFFAQTLSLAFPSIPHRGSYHRQTYRLRNTTQKSWKDIQKALSLSSLTSPSRARRRRVHSGEWSPQSPRHSCDGQLYQYEVITVIPANIFFLFFVLNFFFFRRMFMSDQH